MIRLFSYLVEDSTPAKNMTNKNLSFLPIPVLIIVIVILYFFMGTYLRNREEF